MEGGNTCVKFTNKKIGEGRKVRKEEITGALEHRTSVVDMLTS